MKAHNRNKKGDTITQRHDEQGQTQAIIKDVLNLE